MKMASIPKPLPAARASPESLSRTLLYMSDLSIAWVSGGFLGSDWPPFPADIAQGPRTMRLKPGPRAAAAETTQKQDRLRQVLSRASPGFHEGRRRPSGGLRGRVS